MSFYPVGSIYQSVNETSPASLFGGDWERIQGRFLLGTSSSYKVTSTGGEEKHTLTTSEMPRHMHGSANSKEYWTNPGVFETSSEFSLITTDYASYKMAACQGTGYTGGGGSHNNMPPYYAVNIWRRVS